MTMMREDVLRELELLPLWHLRSSPVALELNHSTFGSSENGMLKDSIIDVPVIAPDVIIDEIIALPFDEQIKANKASLALRVMVSEDYNWLFLLDNSEGSAEQEALLKNILRAMSVKTSIDLKNFELAKCEAYSPKVIVVFGDAAMGNLLGNTFDFETLRLNQHQEKVAKYNAIPVVVTYHPHYLLQDLSSKAKAWDDLCLAMHLMQIA